MSESPLELAWTEYGGDQIPYQHGWVKVRCVLHDDRNASAQVNLETGKWRCFAGCGWGDVYDLVGAKENVREFPDQKRIAAERFGAVLDSDEPAEPSAMNPNPQQKRGKKRWKPAWVA